MVQHHVGKMLNENMRKRWIQLLLESADEIGLANDPVNVAGFVASHVARGDVATVSPDAWKPDGEFLLDVRDPDELAEHGTLGSAANIPLAQLRDRTTELPRDRKIITFCQKGQRGYLAACALHGLGFEDVANLRGGFLHAKLTSALRGNIKAGPG